MADCAARLLAGYFRGSSLDIGNEYLLTSIAVVVIGGTSVGGGKANVPGVWGASLFMVMLLTMLNTFGVSAGIRLLVTGLVIIAVIVAAGGPRDHKVERRHRFASEQSKACTYSDVRDRFDDWVAGLQFVPDYLHHPVLGFKASQAISQFVREYRGFLASGGSLNPSLLGDEPAFAGLSLRRKFPFPAQGGDRFDDWVVGHQFEPDYLHHPVSANRAFPTRRQIGRFCGHFRPLISRIFVSAGVYAFWWRFLAPRLCIQKFRSRQPGLSAKSDRTCTRNSDF